MGKCYLWDTKRGKKVGPTRLRFIVEKRRQSDGFCLMFVNRSNLV